MRAIAWRLCLCLLAACYSPSAVTGAPCTPALDNCPDPQMCAYLGDGYHCVLELPADAAVVPTLDAPVAPVDARADASPAPADAAAPRWVLIQSVGSNASTISVAATGGDHLIVIAIETSADGPVNAITDDGGNSYTAIPTGHAVDATDNLAIELWYATGSQPGTTAISVVAGTFRSAVVWEVSGIRTTNALDVARHLDNQATTLTPVGPNLTTSASGEFVVAVAIMTNMVVGIHPGNDFTNDRRTNGNGWAHLTDPAAVAGTYQAMWDQNVAGAYCTVAAAFQLGGP